jgi:TPR repeat protein
MSFSTKVSTKSANAKANEEITPCRPTLPPLYLEQKLESNHNTAQNSNGIFQSILPSELSMKCLVDYATWGDLAKLSTVQSAFQTILKDAAEFGGQEHKWELAQALLNGKEGLQQNHRLAVKYLLELALGATGAAVDEEFILTLANDENDSNDDTEAKTDLYTPAMRKLAQCYLKGAGVEKDLVKGIAWLKYAAISGKDIDAAHEVALIYEYSLHGVDPDVVLAADWFLKAAEAGHVEAMAEYAMCCELGCGREQSDTDALEWYTRAANMGHVESNFSVGEAFEEAKGVPQSDEEAVMWYYKAAVMGDEDSKKALTRLEDIARILLPGWRDVLRS